MRLAAFLSDTKSIWKYYIPAKIQQQKQKEKINIMVAHIKSHRLVALLIYSSLSIYASHGKNRIHYSNVDRVEINLTTFSLAGRCPLLLLLIYWVEDEEEEKKKSCFLGSCCLFFSTKRMFVLIYRTFTFPRYFFLYFVYTRETALRYVQAAEIFRSHTQPDFREGLSTALVD